MSTTAAVQRRVLRPILYVAVLAALLVPHLAGVAQANHEPADKGAVGASENEIAVFDGDDPVVDRTIFSESVRTSGPADLLISVAAECAISTEIITVGNDASEASGEVRITVLLDGEPIPVDGVSGNNEDEGTVVFCNRVYGRETSMFEDEDATIRSYLRTKASHAFNWITLDVGSGVHDIEVLASLEAAAEGEGTDELDPSAMAAIGNRTMIVESVKFANDEAISDL